MYLNGDAVEGTHCAADCMNGVRMLPSNSLFFILVLENETVQPQQDNLQRRRLRIHTLILRLAVSTF
jgi:hypothetical protein